MLITIVLGLVAWIWLGSTSSADSNAPLIPALAAIATAFVAIYEAGKEGPGALALLAVALFFGAILLAFILWIVLAFARSFSF
jgi:hypothetical protein